MHLTDKCERPKKDRPFDQQFFTSDGECRKRVVARVAFVVQPPTDPKTVSNLTDVCTMAILDEMNVVEVPAVPTPSSQSWMVRAGRNLRHVVNRMNLEGGCARPLVPPPPPPPTRRKRMKDVSKDGVVEVATLRKVTDAGEYNFCYDDYGAELEKLLTENDEQGFYGA